MGKGKFATAINCIDGRTQEPVTNWAKSRFGVDYVDMITEPGADKFLIKGSVEKIEAIRQKVIISVNAHNSRVIVIAGHIDCAGNPVSKEKHLEQIKKCVKIIGSWQLPIQVVGIWLNEKWEVEII